MLSEIAFPGPASIDPAIAQNMVSLHSGEIVVKSRLPQGVWFAVTTPNGHIARVSGSIMIVTFNPVTNTFAVNCIIGHCQIGLDASRLAELEGGDRVWLDEAGNFQGPVAVDLEAFRSFYGDDNLTEEPIPTSTATYTPTETPTETPSPSPTETLTPLTTAEMKGTATAACQKFHQQYPATPCPR